jgi:hypothetical protein
MDIRTRRLSLVTLVAATFVAVGCGGGGDESPEAATTTAPAEVPAAAAAAPRKPNVATGPSSRAVVPGSIPLPTSERVRIATRASDTQAAIRRWDARLAACIGPTGEGDDSDATCTHAAWSELVVQVEVAMYYLLNDLRAMPRGVCHDALAAENDLLRAFWHVAAPLNQAWLDEQQRPPSLFDLGAAVDLVRPVPGRIRGAATSVCAA